MNYKTINLPLSKVDARSLEAGEACLLNGAMYTLRDAGHIRLLGELDKSGMLPYGLSGQVIFMRVLRHLLRVDLLGLLDQLRLLVWILLPPNCINEG